ncbi:MAG TPA: DNA-processing protein DprA [Trebonia sp.]|jgi:DNA processing protein|nr:DNA-processing protein DprA [Trebonia sp.]
MTDVGDEQGDDDYAGEDRIARAALTYLVEPGDPWLATLVGQVGAPRALAAIEAGRFPAAPGRYSHGCCLCGRPLGEQLTLGDRVSADGRECGPRGAKGQERAGPLELGPGRGQVDGVAFGLRCPGCGSPGTGGAGPQDASGRSPGAAGRAGGGRPAGRLGQAAMRAMERWRLRLGEVPRAEDLLRYREQGITLLCPGDPQWPLGLASLGRDEPYALWVRGATADLAAACEHSVGIVGSRAATAYGTYVAADIAASLAAGGWTVVSGGAYGIDGHAHRGALASGGTTVAVLACGPDRYYPAGHAELLDRIAATGAVISEWPPGRNPARVRFLVRNRVIAALTSGTVVVEAGRRSGALNTARHARDLARPLMAVPGPVTSDLSAGCHLILRDWGGVLVTRTEDITEHLSFLPARPPRPDAATATASGAPGARDELDPAAATVLDALPSRGGGLPTGDIAVKAGLEPKVVLGKLAVLAVLGLAERSERGWRLKRQ